MTAQTSKENRIEEHYPDSNASKIQTAISVLSQMETGLDDLSSQVTEMKRKLTSFAAVEAEKAKSEVIDEANREARDQLEAVRRSAQMEADAIVSKGSANLEVFRAKMVRKVSAAADIIVNAVQSF